MTEVVDDCKKFILTVPLYSESVFEPIDNKFKISGNIKLIECIGSETNE